MPAEPVRDEQHLQAFFGHRAVGKAALPLSALTDLRHALESMQKNYFELWLGTWPDAIDWTAAVMGTMVSASLSTLIRLWGPAHQIPLKDEEVNKYFAHSVAYYFGEDAFAIRLQAYDDMLWVVLGWLESIKFITVHSDMQPSRDAAAKSRSSDESHTWYGEQFVPVFAHRARIFYDLAKEGYDYRLCGGGMLWNPSLTPYKNAITNELFISASVGMYLYFPGDANPSPFKQRMECLNGLCPGQRLQHLDDRTTFDDTGIYDPAHLHAAVEGYDWLKTSNMTNQQGLYTDGFHIKDYGVNGTIGTGKCDERNEMVYTYNQGVLLSGLRGLWESTNNRSYLYDGHQLIRDVINATGWDVYKEPHLPGDRSDRRKWYGLGRAGILEEACDASGTCNQDAQTFKGIFFHHLTLFCEPLPLLARKPGKTFAADRETAFAHHSSCIEYVEWVVRNAKAAMNTRDEKGRFGMWWTWGLSDEEPGALSQDSIELQTERTPKGANDYRSELHHQTPADSQLRRSSATGSYAGSAQAAVNLSEPSDPNDRFRGRTVETQGGGLAVIRAMSELVNLQQKDLW